jgi:hypothetical protein
MLNLLLLCFAVVFVLVHSAHEVHINDFHSQIKHSIHKSFAESVVASEYYVMFEYEMYFLRF